MYYTIAVLEDVHNGQKFEFNKNGNEYTISLYDEESGVYVTKDYKTNEGAIKVYQRLMEAVLTGCYSFEQRKQFL